MVRPLKSFVTMNRYLLCYEVGIAGGNVSGCLFTTMNGLTEANLKACSENILEELRRNRPEYQYQNVIWRSVNRLDA